MHTNRQWIILGLIIIVGIFLFITLQPFLNAFLGAVIIYVISQPLMNYFTVRLGWKKTYATALIMIISFFVILLPFSLISYMLTTKISTIVNNSPDIFAILQKAEQWVFDKFGVHVQANAAFLKVQELAALIVPGFLTAIFNTVFSIIVMYFMLYFMLMESGNIQKRIASYLPFTTRNDKVFADELQSQTISNAIGVPLLAIIQGLFAWGGYLVLGVSEPAFWGVLTGFFSFLPVVGSTMIWAPMGIGMILTGSTWHGVAVLLYGAIVIGNVDNLFRLILQKRIANTHPLVTLFGVIMGIQWFGFSGIIFGPLIISYFLILLKTYKTEFLDPLKENNDAQ